MQETSRQTEVQATESGGQVARRVIIVIFLLIEILLAFRLIFKLLGASANSAFTNLIYSITWPFVALFEGIFSRQSTPGAETRGVFEPATLIAMIVVALIAWLVIKLVTPKPDGTVSRNDTEIRYK